MIKTKKFIRCCKEGSAAREGHFTVGQLYKVGRESTVAWEILSDKDSLFLIPKNGPYFEEVPGLRLEAEPKPDMVNSPNHYALFDDIEAIDVIARSMTVEMFRGYCLGNMLKYRLRVGKKDSVEQDLAKANKYKEIFEQHKGKCYDAS